MNHLLQPAQGFPFDELDRRAWFNLAEEQRAWIMQANPDTLLIWHARLYSKTTRTAKENTMLDGLRCFLRLGATLAEQTIRKSKGHGLQLAKR